MAEVNIPKGKYCNGCEILEGLNLPDNSVIYHCAFGMEKMLGWHEIMALSSDTRIEKSKICIDKFGE